MLRWMTWVALVCAATVASPADAGVSIGVQGGVSFSDLSGDAPANTSYGKSAGAVAGGILELDVAREVRLSLQPRFVQRGTRILVAQDDGTSLDSVQVRLDYLSVPILAKIMAGSRRTFVTGGFDLGFPLQVTLDDGVQEQDAGHLVRDFDLAVEVGFGVVFPVHRSSLNLELRYTQSLLNVADFEKEESGGALPVRFRSTSVELVVGFLLPLGGTR